MNSNVFTPGIALVLAASAAFLPAAPASAGMPMSRDMICPVGGESFSFTTTASYSTFGSRPDGKPYGSWTFPLALPVCPGNALVVYREFTPEELPRIEAYMETAEYRDLLAETPYYRAAAMARALDDNAPYLPLSLLMQAGWQAEGIPNLRERYLREMADAVDALPHEPAQLAWVYWNARAANARRELGEFERALEVLEGIPQDLRASARAQASEREIANRLSWDRYRDQLRELISKRNTESEPIPMIPLSHAAQRCEQEMLANGGTMPPACDTTEIREQMNSGGVRIQ